MLWDTFLMMPLQNNQKKFTEERLSIQKQLSDLEVRNIIATGLIKNKNTDQFKQSITQVKGKIKNLDQIIKASLKDQVPDELMANMLNEVLQNNQGIKVLLINNSAAEPLVKTEDKESKEKASKNLNTLGVFMHPLEIILEGTYLEILDYLIALENMGWKIFWDQVRLNVIEHPKVRVQIKMHTFSLKDGWLSV